MLDTVTFKITHFKIPSSLFCYSRGSYNTNCTRWQQQNFRLSIFVSLYWSILSEWFIGVLSDSLDWIIPTLFNVVVFCVMMFWSMMDHILHISPMKFYHLLIALVYPFSHLSLYPYSVMFTHQRSSWHCISQTSPVGMWHLSGEYISTLVFQSLLSTPKLLCFLSLYITLFRNKLVCIIWFGSIFYLAFYQNGSCYSYQQFISLWWCYLVFCWGMNILFIPLLLMGC